MVGRGYIGGNTLFFPVRQSCGSRMGVVRKLGIAEKGEVFGPVIYAILV